ncbi:L domain-like protein [Meredithblackwellia eburnea MCA 4105]
MAGPPPRTPIKVRGAAPSPSTPSNLRSPTKSTRYHSGVSASPQVKEAIQKLREQRNRQPQSNQDAFSAAAADLDESWGLKSDQSVLEKAKKTGRVELTSRQLRRLPPALYRLVSPQSHFYLSNLSKSPSRNGASGLVDFSTATEETMWYEQSDITLVNASNNELSSLEEEFGGFLDITKVDLHNNVLTCLPKSFSQLSRLTHLNLAGNRIQDFPAAILDLPLRHLDLSLNGLRSLWPEELTNPFPFLSTLLLSFSDLRGVFTPTTTITFPSNLVTLDLSSSGILQDGVLFGALSKLNVLLSLDLANNGLTGDLSAVDSTSWERLRTLDLSRNSIDTLASIDEAVERLERIVSWVGLPKTISVLVDEQRSNTLISRSEKTTLEINILENALMSERARRRAILYPPPAPLEVPSRNESAPTSPALSSASSPRLASPEAATPVFTSPILESGSPPLTPRCEAEASTSTVENSPTEAPPPYALDPSSDLSGTMEKKLLIEEKENDEDSKSNKKVEEEPSPVTHHHGADTSGDEAAFALLTTANLSANGTTLVLSHRSLVDLPSPTSHIPTSPRPRKVDLSHNVFPSLPFAAIARWGWGESLTTLDLRSNRALGIRAWAGIVLPHLMELNLADNRLEDEVRGCLRGEEGGDDGQGQGEGHGQGGVGLWELVAMVAPRLRVLDLSVNRLKSLNGVRRVLLPDPGEGGVGTGLVELLLSENQLEDVAGLCEVAEELDLGGGDARGRWKCNVLDLRQNNISRLPPTLGKLPLTVQLLVDGNTFRIPRREVYLDRGPSGLLEWLRDRC